MIQSLHDIIEKRVADFVGIASSQLPMRVPAALRHRVSEIHGLPVWERLQAPIIAHVGNLKGSFYTTTIASSPDVRHGSVEYTVSGYIHLEESRMSESASSQSQSQEVKFREGCPSVDHVEAALRLGLEWRCQGVYNDTPYRFIVRDGEICADCAPYMPDDEMPKVEDFKTSRRLPTRTWRPCRQGGCVVPWSVLDAEVARFKATTTTPPALAPTQRFNVGDAVMCSTFTDGTAGVRIACASDIARNLGVGKIEGCWQDHSRYRVRNLGTDEVHIWPASALQGVENWGLKVGDEVVTPRFTSIPDCTFVSDMERCVGKTDKISKVGDFYIRAHDYRWPTYDVAVATAKAKLRKSVGAASSQPAPAQKLVEFRQLTRGIIEANPGQLWERNPIHAGQCALYQLRYTNRVEWAGESGFWCNWFGPFNNEFRPICAATKLPMSWDELKPSLDEAKPSTLPRDGDPMTVDGAVAIAEESARRVIERHLGAGVHTPDDDAYQRRTLTAALIERGATDIRLHRTPGGVLAATYDIAPKSPVPHIAQEITMPTSDAKAATTNPTTDSQTTKKPSRGRLAIDAAKMRAPVELGLNRMHKIVAKKALKMFKGTRQEKAVVQRFLSDVLQSEYGKAFMGAAAATIVPYGASLPGLGKHADTLDAVADELAKRSATVLAVELGGTLLDAVEPLIAIVSDMVAKTAESGGVEVVDVPAEAARLSAPQQSSPDFSGSITASSMRCRTSA